MNTLPAIQKNGHRTPRRLAAVAIAACAVAALSACEKPGPGATVQSGTDSSHRSALCWNNDPAGHIDPASCAADVFSGAVDGASLPQVTVIPGNVIGVSVDPVVADNGWRMAVNGETVTQAPVHSNYFRFAMPDLAVIPEDGMSLEIAALSQDGQNLRGIWMFTLTPAG